MTLSLEEQSQVTHAREKENEKSFVGIILEDRDGLDNIENIIDNDYIDMVLVHMWEEPKKMDDPEVIKAAFEESGFDANKLLEQMQDPEVKAKLIANTEEAVEKGVFGIPTFFVGNEMFFGKDKLWEVEELLND